MKERLFMERQSFLDLDALKVTKSEFTIEIEDDTIGEEKHADQRIKVS